jgi:hypothetical protein
MFSVPWLKQGILAKAGANFSYRPPWLKPKFVHHQSVREREIKRERERDRDRKRV